jgi:hypothetical protein
MVVTQAPSLAEVYYSLLQTRAAHSNTGGPPLDPGASSGPAPRSTDGGKAATDAATSQVNILA